MMTFLTNLPDRASGRWSVAGLGFLLAGAMLALNCGGRDMPQALAAAEPSASAEASSPVPVDLPSREECLKNWPGFRGFLGSGISPYDNVPTRWDVTTGEGIAWKSPVPLAGNSSPVVWKDRLFLTGATQDSRQVFCYDTTTGRLLWQGDVPGAPAGDLQVNNDTGFASPTPATDGRRVYVSFASGDFAAFDFAGHLVWARSLGVPKDPYGHATSLRLYRNLLLVQLDQGTAKEELSRLLALDTATGKTVWEVKRPVPSSWSTPIVIEVKGQDQVVTCGDPWVIAYNPSDGKELWRADCLKQDIGPSPVFADGVVYAAVEYRAASAIKADGRGDVTATHVLWSDEDDVPDICSPLAAGPYVFLLTSSGSTLTCCDAKSGQKLWTMDIDSPFMASPSQAGKYVYLFGADGKAFILEPGPAGAKTVFTTDMGDKVFSSPAFQDGRIYVRGQTDLFCIGKK